VRHGITAITFLCLLLGSLLCITAGSDRLSGPLTWLGLALLGITVGAAVWLGWPL
jgi:hypothetical protein